MGYSKYTFRWHGLRIDETARKSNIGDEPSQRLSTGNSFPLAGFFPRLLTECRTFLMGFFDAAKMLMNHHTTLSPRQKISWFHLSNIDRPRLRRSKYLNCLFQDWRVKKTPGGYVCSKWCFVFVLFQVHFRSMFLLRNRAELAGSSWILKHLTISICELKRRRFPMGMARDTLARD